MTESMVERVARAIARHRNRVDRGWDVDDGWDIAEGRVAILAMRELTEAMIEAVKKAEQEWDEYEPIPWDYAWPVALNAALAEDQDTAGGGGTTTTTG
jgi:hypothetical protein